MIMHLYVAATVITFPNASVPLTVTEGDQTILTCTARGVPAPEFTWYRGSELISGSDTRLQVSSGTPMSNTTTGYIFVTSELSISAVNRTDTGVFRCETTNIVLGEATTDSQTYSVTVNCKFRLQYASW